MSIKVRCTDCGVYESVVAKFICRVCGALSEEEARRDEEFKAEHSCAACVYACEDLHGPHCGPCLASWPEDAAKGPLWTEA